MSALPQTACDAVPDAPDAQVARVARRLAPCACELLAGGELTHARVAASCLLQPEPGDLVLAWRAQAGPSYVLAVLERPLDAGCVRLPGGAELHAGAGALRLRARCVELLAERARVHAVSLQLRADRAFAWLGDVQARGRSWLTRLERSVVELGDSLRRVRGLDESHVEQQRMRVRQRLHIQARDTSIVCERRVRVDARHIDLG